MGKIIDMQRYKQTNGTLTDSIEYCLSESFCDRYTAAQTILDYIRFNVETGRKYFVSIDDLIEKMPVFFYMPESDVQEYRFFYKNMEADLEGINSLLSGEREASSDFDNFIISNII